MSALHKGWRISKLDGDKCNGTVAASGIIGKHKGRTGIVIANGPSLQLLGQEKLQRFIEQQDCVVIGYNRMWEAFGDGTEDIPCHYLGMLDYSYWKKNWAKRPDGVRPLPAYLNKYKPIVLTAFRPAPRMDYIGIAITNGLQAKHIPRYHAGQVYNGHNGGCAMCQIAVHMGFKDIFIIGCDCGTANGRSHAWGTRPQHATYGQGDRFLPGFNHLPKWSAETGSKLWNLSLISRITAIPKIDIDAMLSGNSVDQSIVEGQPVPLAMSRAQVDAKAAED